MTFDQKQIAAALALLALGFVIGRRAAAAKAATTGAAAHNDTAEAPEQWWTFAGSWAS